MTKGYSVVVGMTIAYAVSFFGLLLAYIVYQRNHHQDELWRRRPVGVSFYAALYGYVLPVIFIGNSLLTLGIKLVKGWEFNRFVWTSQALIWPPLAAILLYWLVGRLCWKIGSTGYVASLLLCVIAIVGLVKMVFSGISAETADLHLIGSCVTGLIWHAAWSFYFLRPQVRTLFLKPT